MAQWFPARLCSAAGALRRAQQHEMRKSPGTSFSEFSFQRFSETRTDRHFLASGVGETLSSKLERVIDTTETNLECWNDWLFA